MFEGFNGGEALAMVEFREQGGGPRPFSVVSVTADGRHCSTYDVDWCKRDRVLYYHFSGGGSVVGGLKVSEASYWAAPGVEVAAPDGATRLDALPSGYAPENALPGYELGGDWSEGDVAYCRDCDDWLPEDEPCQHSWWCALTPQMSTSDEPCGHERSLCDEYHEGFDEKRLAEARATPQGAFA